MLELQELQEQLVLDLQVLQELQEPPLDLELQQALASLGLGLTWTWRLDVFPC